MDRMGRIPMRQLQGKRKFYGYRNDRHHVMNFKQFVSSRDDAISPEKAAEEYTKYLSGALNDAITKFYDKYQDYPFFREKYHPHYLQEDYKVIKNIFLSRSSQFITDYESGKFQELLLELSFKRLYGKSMADELQNDPDVAYGYNEWVAEIPLEYPKDESVCRRLPLISPLQSVLLVDVPGKVFKFEVINAVKHRIENFPIYFAERDVVRTAFIYVPENENLKKLSDDLNADRLNVHDFLLRFEPCDPLKDRIRIRVCPPICSHPIIIMKDLALTGKLIRKLDAELGRTENSLVDLLPEDLDMKLRLDLHLIYLRMVHNYCYYGRYKTQNYIDLWDVSGPGHVRVDFTNELYEKEEGLTTNNLHAKFTSVDVSRDFAGVKEELNMNGKAEWEEQLTSTCKVSDSQLQWLKDVEVFALRVLDSDLAPPEYVEDTELIEDRWNKFCNLNTIIDGPERFRCKMCQKLFNEAKFVSKHIKLRHFESYDKIVIESGLHQMRDLFFNAHKDTQCNPYDRLVSIPVIQKPVSDFDVTAGEFKRGGEFNRMGVSNKRKRREYHDFDRPQIKKDQVITFAADEYCRPSVTYDDL